MSSKVSKFGTAPMTEYEKKLLREELNSTIVGTSFKIEVPDGWVVHTGREGYITFKIEMEELNRKLFAL